MHIHQRMFNFIILFCIALKNKGILQIKMKKGAVYNVVKTYITATLIYMDSWNIFCSSKVLQEVNIFITAHFVIINTHHERLRNMK